MTMGWVGGCSSSEISFHSCFCKDSSQSLLFTAKETIISSWVSLTGLTWYWVYILERGSNSNPNKNVNYPIRTFVVWLLSHVCLFCDPMDCNPPGSSVHGILQARILEWVAISFSRGSSQSRDWVQVSCLVGRFFTWEASGPLIPSKQKFGFYQLSEYMGALINSLLLTRFTCWRKSWLEKKNTQPKIWGLSFI